MAVAVEAQEIDPDTAEPLSYRVIVTLDTNRHVPIDDRIRREDLLDP